MTKTDEEVRADAAERWALGGDLSVARTGFGAMRLPMRDFGIPGVDPRQAIAVLRRALELGVDHIDTAAFYFHQDVTANALIREALHPYRDGLVIATKVGPGRRRPDGKWLTPAGPAELKAAVHANLRELGLDSLDLVYLRLQPPDDGDLAERFGALAELRDEGLIRHLGISNATADQLAEAQRVAPVAAVQNRFSVGSRTDAAVLDACTDQSIAFVPYYPLVGKGGDQAVSDAALLKEIAGRYGVSPAQVKLAWLLALSPSVLIIPGTSSPAHLEENVAAGALRLDAADLAALDSMAGVSRSDH
ncbi:aldo/keto reductase [Streptomyces sp. NBC_01465]|uniref:aldo/keto reductase n=1 Tax=Streptomyces sp. NBC_01465 TaxID=2903878 RepID=UPI002E3181E4|nr:aldo/keto reductase [Streptomyces sp. NBC_01465]